MSYMGIARKLVESGTDVLSDVLLSISFIFFSCLYFLLFVVFRSVSLGRRG